MIGLGVVALGMGILLAASNALPLLLDLIHFHFVVGPDVVKALDCAQQLARARAGL